MNWFDFIKRYYGYGAYAKDDVAIYVELGKITPDQYSEITGDQYSTERPTG